MTIASQLPTPKSLLPNEGESYQLLTHIVVCKITGEDTNGKYTMFEVIDTADNTVPFHSHPWEETFYILEGEVEIQVGEHRSIATVGSLNYIPANIPHKFKICSEIARMLVIISPASAEEFYREIAEKIPSLPADSKLLEEICAKHNVRLL
jgi:quercetin dioxygenase-like cupin family protein